VHGVATFYHLFTFAPPGRHTCVVCTGTACYVKGADAILAGLEKEIGVAAGRTSEGGAVSLTTARCLGACGLAPVNVYDGQVAGQQTVELAVARVKGWSDGSR
jgi:bidirectional [NiFe] hydrogenase diaphorase subunit